MHTTAQYLLLSLEELGPDDSCGISEGLDPSLLGSPRGRVHLMWDLKCFPMPKGLFFPKKFPNAVRVPAREVTT